jgi:hypothetical protein
MPGATDYTATYTATNLLNYITGQLAGRRTRRRLPGRKRIDRRGFGGQALPLETPPPLHVARAMVYGIHL